MPLVRLNETTKDKLPLVQKELVRNVPEFDGMKLSQDFLINRAINWYLKNTPFEQVTEENK